LAAAVVVVWVNPPCGSPDPRAAVLQIV